MLSLIIKKFVKNREAADDPAVRGVYGVICGAAGVIINIMLCAFKLIAGGVSGAISITADGLNNLSDAFSSFVALAGFRMSRKRPDREHPYGHGRMEYVAGLVVAIFILFMAWELIRSAISRIRAPAPVELSYWVVAALVISILVKLYMALYNRKYARVINSEVMRAASVDSYCDMAATFVVLASALISHFWGVKLDGWCALAVGLFVLTSGVKITKNTISTIIGKTPDQMYFDSIKALVLAHDEVVGVHDIVVHDYGPGRAMVSLHAEIPASDELLRSHAMIDRIESELEQKLGCEAVIHIDPKRADDKPTSEARKLIQGILYAIDPNISMHDFRLEDDNAARRVCFDIVTPDSLKLSDDEIRKRLEGAAMINLSMPLSVRIDRGRHAADMG